MYFCNCTRLRTLCYLDKILSLSIIVTYCYSKNKQSIIRNLPVLAYVLCIKR